MILMYFFETYLDLRQHAAHKLPTLPKPLLGVISQEKFEKSRAYSLDKRLFATFSCSIMLLVALILKVFQKRKCSARGRVFIFCNFIFSFPNCT